MFWSTWFVTQENFGLYENVLFYREIEQIWEIDYFQYGSCRWNSLIYQRHGTEVITRQFAVEHVGQLVFREGYVVSVLLCGNVMYFDKTGLQGIEGCRQSPFFHLLMPQPDAFTFQVMSVWSEWIITDSELVFIKLSCFWKSRYQMWYN